MSLRSFGALFLLLALAGCERAVVTNDYFPLRDGNRWEYRLLDAALLKRLAEGQSVETRSTVSGEAGEPETGTEARAEVVEEAAEPRKPEPVPARPARRVALVLKEDVDDVTARAAYDGLEQVWSKRGGYVSFQDARGRHYLLILPPHTGYRWVATTDAGQDLYYEIEGQEDLATPAGFFRLCAVARQENRDKRETFRYWFAPGVGLVRRSKYYLNEEVFRQELVAKEVRASTLEVRAAEDREIQQALKGKHRGNEFRRGAAQPAGAREP